jgi:thiamine biosynthesis lipoprotein
MKYSFQALGTQWWIEIFDELATQRGDEIKDFITSYVSTYEQNYSRFQPDSLVSTLNRDRTVVNPTPEFVQLLEYGKRLYLRSDTHFNLLTGHILESKGYDADYTFTASGPAVGPGNPVIDLQISPDLIKLAGGANLDLGGFGKGYLVDLLARQLQHTHSIEQF